MKVRVLFLILIVSFTILFAGGRKPIEFYSACKLIRLSGEENKMVDNLYLQWAKDKPKEKQRSWYKFETHPLLANIFPEVKFYKLFYGISLPPQSCMKAEFKGKFYKLPVEFNRLLLDNGFEVDEKNIIELAKAFVVIASEGFALHDLIEELLKSDTGRYLIEGIVEEEKYKRGFPQITFLEGKRSIDKKKTPPVYRAFLKVKVGDQTQIYSFRIRRGQIEEAKMNIEGETVIHYFHLKVIKISPKRGELDLNGEINIVTTPPSDAYVEWEKDIPHYYLIVKKNNEPTGYCVQFHLSGFQPNQQHIVILVRSINSRYADTLLRQPVAINSNGEGSFLWVPSSETTCITKVWAIDTISGDTTLSKKLTLEKVITGIFPNGDSFWVYFCG
ncbi:MAG: hypothetical protein NZ608_04365 [candidate division WOR-3 bacterium]|nr:hypothetical protein [candidate division WOR-3 bacterium]